ncbi:S-phase kinase-associated protein 1 [Pseudolycoriella hygida]|uniref:S-phase kinase-associated protein 1 n=1 Tax=Pseudolycoriella hygida TaxID=35572 RepID=A0A9Q0N5B1_9DIPT|nr:S-phase kinase-associated protein 1 [Pseudolycoriella hygida]
MIRLQSSDGKIFETDLQIARIFNTIKAVVEAATDDQIVDVSMHESAKNKNVAKNKKVPADKLKQNNISGGDIEIVDGIIVIHLVKSSILRIALDWATHHKNDVNDEFNDEMLLRNFPRWDVDFMKFNALTTLELVGAASYLGVKGLLYLAGFTLCDLVGDKSEGEIDDLFSRQVHNF